MKDLFEVKYLIDEAAERCGLLPSSLNQLKISSAIHSLNIVLSNLTAKMLPLWTIDTFVEEFKSGQSGYFLPYNYLDIIETASIHQFERFTKGAAFSSTGNATLAFDGNVLTPCVLDQQGDYLGITFDKPRTVNVIGLNLTNNTDGIRTFSIQYRLDNAYAWHSIFVIDQERFENERTRWFEMPIACSGSEWRVVVEDQKGEASIGEFYLGHNLLTRPLGPESRSDFFNRPLPSQMGEPSQYTFRRQLPSSLQFWPTPNGIIWTHFSIKVKRSINAVEKLTDTIQVHPDYISVIVSQLAYLVALKNRNEVDGQTRVELREEANQELMAVAPNEQQKNVPIVFTYEED